MEEGKKYEFTINLNTGRPRFYTGIINSIDENHIHITDKFGMQVVLKKETILIAKEVLS